MPTATSLRRAFVLSATASTLACGAPPAADPLVLGRASTVEVPPPGADETGARGRAVEPAPDPRALLLDPSSSAGPAPESFRVRFETTKGAFVVRCERAWAPNGVDRFHQLVRIGFFRDVAVFRVVRGFVAQFGIHGDPAVSRAWRDAEIPADEVKRSNVAGSLTFAMAGRPTSRTTQLFFNLVDNERLDEMGFAPVCEIVPPGLDVVGLFFDDYGEQVSRQQGRFQDEGNELVRREFPELDIILDARVVE